MTERRVLTCEQIRQVDRVAIEQWGIPGIVLMENAGRGVADVMCEIGITGPVIIACAKGNNGGDGFVIARHLHLRGYDVRVLRTCEICDLQGDAAWNYELLQRCSVTILDLESTSQDVVRNELEQAEWLVDALLGTGATGELREPLASLVHSMNQSPAKKLAIDIPTGLDAKTGKPTSRVFRADHTCTFVAEKASFENNEAQSCLGNVHTLDIGLPWELVEAALR